MLSIFYNILRALARMHGKKYQDFSNGVEFRLTPARSVNDSALYTFIGNDFGSFTDWLPLGNWWNLILRGRPRHFARRWRVRWGLSGFLRELNVTAFNQFLNSADNLTENSWKCLVHDSWLDSIWPPLSRIALGGVYFNGDVQRSIRLDFEGRTGALGPLGRLRPDAGQFSRAFITWNRIATSICLRCSSFSTKALTVCEIWWYLLLKPGPAGSSNRSHFEKWHRPSN
jgi:hypothetical protein